MKKRKNCIECKKELPGIRSRFCSDKCYLFHKSKAAKRIAKLKRKNLPPIPCHICGKKFKPIRADHKNCSKACTRMDIRNKRKNNLYAYQANQDTKVRFEVVKPFSHIPKPLPLKIAKKRISKHTNPLFCNSTSEERDRLKNAVQEFIERGGIITKYPDEIPLKEESVKIIERFTMDDSDSFSISEEINELINEHDNPNSASQ